MDEHIKLRLDRVKRNAQQTLQDIEWIYGFCDGMETAANHYYSPSTRAPLQLNANNFGNGFGTQPRTSKQILKEIEEMIIELKINGSLREHRNGLYKFTTSNGKIIVYGRTREAIQTKLLKKIALYFLSANYLLLALVVMSINFSNREKTTKRLNCMPYPEFLSSIFNNA